jgi:hypothetical protein
MQTRRFLAAVIASVFAAPLLFAASMSSTSKSLQFYGTLSNVSSDSNSITVHNKKKNADATFKFNDQTRVTRAKQSIAPTELKVGESLVVYYVSENDIARAKRISVRNNTFKKKQSQ